MLKINRIHVAISLLPSMPLRSHTHVLSFHCGRTCYHWNRPCTPHPHNIIFVSQTRSTPPPRDHTTTNARFIHNSEMEQQSEQFPALAALAARFVENVKVNILFPSYKYTVNWFSPNLESRHTRRRSSTVPWGGSNLARSQKGRHSRPFPRRSTTTTRSSMT
jgi:hypothetical protein